MNEPRHGREAEASPPRPGDAAVPSIAVIGLGFGAVHARVLGEMESVHLKAVCDTDPARLAAASRGRRVNAYTTCAEMLAAEKLDAVVIAVPTRLHEEVALAALEAGIGALLIEKPIAPSLPEAVRLVAAVEKAGARLMPGHIERFNPAISELQRRVAAGDAGRLLRLTARRMGPFAPRTRDVSVIHDLALHDIDVMRFMLGREVERVFADGHTGVRTEFDDSLSGLVRFEGDSPECVLEVNWLTPRKVRDLWLLGDRGLFIADYGDALAPSLDFHPAEGGERGGLGGGTWSNLVSVRGRANGSVLQLPLETREPLERELSEFVAAVTAGTDLPVDRNDALAAIAIADALAESVRTGLPVKPERFP